MFTQPHLLCYLGLFYELYLRKLFTMKHQEIDKLIKRLDYLINDYESKTSGKINYSVNHTRLRKQSLKNTK